MKLMVSYSLDMNLCQAPAASLTARVMAAA